MIAISTESSSGDETRDGAARGAPTRRRLLRGIALGMLLGLAAAVVVFVWMGRGQTPRLTEEAYRAAVTRWEKNGPQDYVLDVELAGKRPGKVHVEVRDGQVVHMTRDGVEPRQKRTWEYWSVPGMLETIGQELDMARDPAAAFNDRRVTQMVMWAEFDAEFGYPRSYDRVVMRGDFEVHWKVTRFTPSPPKNSSASMVLARPGR